MKKKKEGAEQPAKAPMNLTWAYRWLDTVIVPGLRDEGGHAPGAVRILDQARAHAARETLNWIAWRFERDQDAMFTGAEVASHVRGLIEGEDE